MNPSNEPDDFETVMAVRHRYEQRTPCSNDGMANTHIVSLHFLTQTWNVQVLDCQRCVTRSTGT